MEGQKGLTRTKSSLLRSSPTIRSSIQSFSSVDEITNDQEFEDLEEQKFHSKNPVQVNPVRYFSCLGPVFAIVLLCTYTLFTFYNRDDIPTSECLLLALVFVAVLLFFISRNRNLVTTNVCSCKKFCQRFNFSCFKTKTGSKQVQWFIGESNLANYSKNSSNLNEEWSRNESSMKKIIREGVEFYSNGDFYEGEFHNGKCNGSGVYNYFVNGRYEGDWIDGRYDGYGIESWARGSRYKGQYRQGLRHGYGVYKFYTGDSYSGEWCNGQSHGVGIQTCADGSCFVGEFKCGVKHGLGCYHFRNGDRYAGEYFGDKVHGFGVYHFANCHCYEGSWHEGKKQGYGMYTFRNGERRCGEWDSGNLKTPLPPLTDTVLRAVQAARKTAEIAIKLRQVEEQVSKAVTAANKAATAARVAAVKAVQNRIDGKFCDTDS